MSFEAMAWAWSQRSLTSSQRLTLLALADRINRDTGQCVPSIATVMKDANLSERTVQNSLRDLIGAGLIERIVRYGKTGGQVASAYRLNLHIAASAPPMPPKPERHQDDDPEFDDVSYGGDPHEGTEEYSSWDGACFDAPPSQARITNAPAINAAGRPPQQMHPNQLLLNQEENPLYSPTAKTRFAERRESDKPEGVANQRGLPLGKGTGEARTGSPAESPVSIRPQTTPENGLGSPPDAFEAFWRSYPRKVGKEAARKAFSKIRVGKGLLATMLAAIEAQKRSPDWRKEGGQFIPHPATWLNQGRWQDEIAPPPADRTPWVQGGF